MKSSLVFLGGSLELVCKDSALPIIGWHHDPALTYDQQVSSKKVATRSSNKSICHYFDLMARLHAILYAKSPPYRHLLRNPLFPLYLHIISHGAHPSNLYVSRHQHGLRPIFKPSCCCLLFPSGYRRIKTDFPAYSSTDHVEMESMLRMLPVDLKRTNLAFS